MVAVEAGLRGLPVIATRRGALPSIISEGESGLLVDRGSAEQIADAAQRLASDSELWQRLSRGAAERVSTHFSLRASAEKMLDILAASCENQPNS
jgi:glycosyltransferase involved in cell wall biosynthesis